MGIIEIILAALLAVSVLGNGFLIATKITINNVKIEVTESYAISISESGSISMANSTVILSNASLTSMIDPSNRVIYYPAIKEKIQTIISNGGSWTNRTNWTELVPYFQ